MARGALELNSMVHQTVQQHKDALLAAVAFRFACTTRCAVSRPEGRPMIGSLATEDYRGWAAANLAANSIVNSGLGPLKESSIWVERM